MILVSEYRLQLYRVQCTAILRAPQFRNVNIENDSCRESSPGFSKTQPARCNQCRSVLFSCGVSSSVRRSNGVCESPRRCESGRHKQGRSWRGLDASKGNLRLVGVCEQRARSAAQGIELLHNRFIVYNMYIVTALLP